MNLNRTHQQTSTPGGTSAAGVLLVIHHPIGGRRVAAHAFDLEGGGIAWVDSGWTTNDTGHTVHAEAGEVTEAGAYGWLLEAGGEEIAIIRYDGDGNPDGERQAAREALELELGLNLR